MAWARFGEDTRSVSDVIGTVLLLGITTALFSVFSVAVLDQLDRNPPPSNVEFRVDSNDERTTLVAVWGESLEIQETRLLYEVGGVRTVGMLSEEPLFSNLIHRGVPNSRWDLGEALKLACPVGETCAHPGETVKDITVTQTSSNAVVFSSEPGVSPGSLVNPVPDLIVTIQSIDDPNLGPERPFPYNLDSNSALCPAANDDLYTSGGIVIKAAVSNAGIIPTPTGSTLTVKFYLDGVPFHTIQRSQFLAAGESFTTQNDPPITVLAGLHSIRVEVTKAPSFTEATQANNQATRSSEVVTGTCDPGFPYEDGDDDLLFNPYSHPSPDLAVLSADVEDGVYWAGGARNLVIPASVGTIYPTQTIDFRSGGDIILGVNLQQNSSTNDIRLNAARNINLTGSVDFRGRDYINITAAGTIDLSDGRLDSQSDDHLHIYSSGGPIIAVGTWFYIPGWHEAAGPDPTPPGNVKLTTSNSIAGYINIQGAVFNVTDHVSNSTGSIDVDAAGNLHAQNVRMNDPLSGATTIDLRALDVIRIDGAILRGTEIMLHLKSGGTDQIYVGGAPLATTGVTIDDNDDCARTNPLLNEFDIIGTEILPGRVEDFGLTCL